jgi:CBS domain containing-hemolysin-like protein
MSDWAGILWLFVLLLGNAFFVGAEFAVVTARRSQIEPLAERGSRRARTALWAMEHATLMLAATQLGITICSLLILNVSEPAIHHLLEVPLGWLGLGESATATAAFVITVLLVSFLHVVFGEMVPKNIAFSMPDRAVLLLAPPLVGLDRVFKPVIWALNRGADLVLIMFGIRPQHAASTAYTLDQVATIVAESTKEGTLDDPAGTLGNTFEFTEKRGAALGGPRRRLRTLPEGVTPEQVEDAVGEFGFSRYPVTGPAGTLIGYIHLKDVLDLPPSRYAEPVPHSRIRQLITIAASTELEDALTTMQRQGAHVARVSDDIGHVVGALFFEDIIEVLVGEVHDATQHDEAGAAADVTGDASGGGAVESGGKATGDEAPGV